MSKNRTKSRFGSFMKIYTIILAVIAASICVVVWTKLKKYQNDYDSAKQAGSATNYVQEFVSGLDYDSILEYINKYGLNVMKGINPEINHARYFDNLISVYGASFRENEKNTNSIPRYDIMAGDVRIAVISLKASGKNDEFGFHGWVLKDMAFDTDEIEYTDIDIWVPAECKVAYNMQELSDEYIVENSVSDDDFTRKLKSLGVSVPDDVRYHIEYTFGNRNIAAINADGQMLKSVVNGSVYDFRQGSTAMPDDLQTYVMDAMDSYIYTLYKKKSFGEIEKYIEKDSDAYRMISEVLTSAAWGWTPDTVDILEHDITDYVSYGDDFFTCRYYGRIYKFKDGAMESGEEEFNYRIIFRNISGKWLMDYFILTKEAQ